MPSRWMLTAASRVGLVRGGEGVGTNGSMGSKDGGGVSTGPLHLLNWGSNNSPGGIKILTPAQNPRDGKTFLGGASKY